MTSATQSVTIKIPRYNQVVPTAELEDIIVAVLDEYMERKSDEQLRKEIESSLIIAAQTSRLQKLYAT